MYTNVIRVNLLAVILLATMISTSIAQSPMAPDDDLIGIIPGTSMTRDEFRARANAQLSAIALNAETYRMTLGEYPDSFYSLFNSSAWNLDPVNMFSGNPINGIAFEASSENLIPNHGAGLLPGANTPESFLPPQPIPSEGGDEGNPEGDPATPDFSMNPNAVTKNAMSVDPGQVRNVVFGDVFYRAFDDTLQLLMYAPDGTYFEVFHNSPNLYWHRNMAAVAIGSHWPEDGYAGQVMYFTETMLPRFYNHVMFMADYEILPGSALHMYGVEARLQMAEELGITILNPFTKQPIKLVDVFEVGNFAEPDPSVPLPIFFCFPGNRVLCLDQIHEMQEIEALEAKQGKKARNPRRPAMGGSR